MSVMINILIPSTRSDNSSPSQTHAPVSRDANWSTAIPFFLVRKETGPKYSKKKKMNKINLKFKSFSLNKRLEGRIQEKMGVSSFILLAFIAFTVSFCVFPRPYVVS